ncbi:MAG: hypothetical protein O7B99_08675 [Planctomycetota bacterium]|nr:hypothetical protein [Planctomycetota bacterium]
MTRAIPIVLGGAFLSVAGVSLSTDYTSERTLRIECETVFEMETTAFEMERDGEVIDRPFGGGNASKEVRRVAYVDQVTAHADGEPTAVRRAFEEVDATNTSEFGEESNESDAEGPLAGVTLELSLEDGEIVVEVVEGEEPDEDAALEGHGLTLALDALLPPGDVGEDASWDLEQDAILRALGLDLEDALFPRVEREEEERPEGRRGGRGGFRGGRGGGSTARQIVQLEWEGTATLAEESGEWEGRTCAIVDLEIEASGELPEPEFGGRGGRGFSFEPASSTVVENTFSVKLEGQLYFSVEDGMPLGLELEGTMTNERTTNRERGESTIRTSTTREGTYTYRVVVTVE